MHAQVDQVLGYDSVPTGAAAHPFNQQLLAYWESRRLPGGPIRRADFEPLDIPRILPGVFIAEPLDDDYRFRLAGSDIEMRTQRKVMGATLRDVLGDLLGQRTIESYRLVSLGSEPLVVRGKYLSRALEHIDFEVLHMPIEFDSGVRGVLGGHFPFD